MLNNNFIDIRLGDAKKDDSQVVEQSLIATTANIVGTAYKGPAFVPQKIFAGQTVLDDVPVYNTLQNIFGTLRQNQHAHLYDNYSCHADGMSYDAAALWLNNGGVYSSFTRVLGIGTGTKDENTGKMSNSGFNAENNISSGTLSHERGPNPNAIANGQPGNVTFLLKTFDQKNSKAGKYIEELGIDTSGNKTPHYISDVYLFASGVLPSLTTESISNDGTYFTGSYDYTDQTKQITSNRSNQSNLELLGHNPYIQDENKKPSSFIRITFGEESNKIVKQGDYSDNKSNRFHDRMYDRGHLNYASFSFNGLNKEANSENKITILTAKPYSVINNNTLPDYNSFENEFTTAKTPWITAQPFNREGLDDNRENIHERVQNLFRFWSLDDGEVGNRFRIKINPKTCGDSRILQNAKSEEFATFDVYIFEYEPRNNTFEQLEYYEDANLDPDSNNYIGKLIGTVHTYYDFDAQKVVEKGLYENKSQFLRVEIDDNIKYKSILNQHELIPSGFRSYPHISLKKDAFDDWYGNGLDTIFDTDGVYHMPPMYAIDYYEDNVLGEGDEIDNNWGVIFTQPKLSDNLKQVRATNPSLENYISPHFYYTKYFLNGLSNSNKDVWVEQDNYLNSFFHLEKIYLSFDAEAANKFRGVYSYQATEDNNNYIRYKHSGKDDNVPSKQYLNLNETELWESNRKVISTLRNKLSFDFFTYGGFDGVDIRDSDKRFLKNDAIIRELNDTNEVKSTYTSYDNAIDIAMDEANCAGDLFLMPGIREIPLVDKVLKKCEEDRRHFLIADISGAASNRLISFNKIEIDDNNNVSDGDSVKKSLGIMGNYYFLENTLSSYRLNDKEINDIDNRFSLDVDINGDEVFYNYVDVLRNQHTYTISTWKGLDLRSRYIMPTFGDVIGSNNDNFSKQITSDSFVLGKIAQLISPRQSLNLTDLPQLPGDIGQISYKLINEEDLSENNLNFDVLTRDFRNSAVNVLYKNKDNEISLLSENTSYENRKSIFQLQSIVRTIQEIKKIIKFDIFTNESLVEGGILFGQNSSLKNIYVRLRIQLENLMQSFKDAGYVQDYKVMIPDSTDSETILDMQNYIVRGQIILQFGDSDIIKLSIDEVLSNLSLLSDTNQDSVLVLNV